MDQYAIINTGGKQYRIKAGDVVRVEKIAGKNEGDSVELELVPMAGDAGKATGTVVAEGRADKIIVLKKHRRQTYRKRNGHRQSFHDVRIDALPTV